jgi:hypothetical protein
MKTPKRLGRSQKLLIRSLWKIRSNRHPFRPQVEKVFPTFREDSPDYAGGEKDSNYRGIFSWDSAFTCDSVYSQQRLFHATLAKASEYTNGYGPIK